jgi:hypothetical protein
VFGGHRGLSVATAGCGITTPQGQARVPGTPTVSTSRAITSRGGEVRRGNGPAEDVLHSFHLEPAYFFLANSYDNLDRTSKKGDATNDGYMSKAVDYYKKDAQLDPDPKMKKLSLQYLVAAYGPDKLNDPSQQEPILQQMIQVDPTDPGELLLPRQHLRAERRLREGRSAVPEGEGNEAERPGRLHDAGGVLRPAG